MKIQVLEKPPFSQLISEKEQYLSQIELKNLYTLPETRHHDFLAGRFALKKLFTSLTADAVPLPNIDITTVNKKPQIRFNNTTYYCSISHSKKYVACSIDTEVENGIDIEEQKPRSPELQQYILGNGELSYFDTDEEFLTTRAWCIKEAAFKSDSDQGFITHYTIYGKHNDVFLVQNTKTGRKIRVRSQVIDNYTVSYTIQPTL